MPTFSHDHTTYHYRVSGDGPPLLLMHGFTGSLASWTPLLPWLSRFHRVITVDLPGHGRTVAPATPEFYTMERTAAGVAALIDAVTTAPVHLLGYSMGGRLALYFALHYPELVRALLLESASPGLPTDEERTARRARDDALATRIERDGIPAFVARWEMVSLFASQAKLPATVRVSVRAQRLQNQADGLANSLRGMGTGAQPSLWLRLAEVRAPTLLMAGEHDAKFCAIARAMNARMRNGNLAIIPGAGHTIHLERPHTFIRHTLTWLHNK